ncbi:succinylglutamate desuccinylase/aspartoacylase family protein [Roseomonas sp. OT10]|uniref:succinylglutamate desuccinylase/aspartoacylase domain-containing protein n=1 Tax=Roseomonas cutis TaxID=2897332 RepID=UPI001E397D58|nr:succinylglutamate desuccinylase/aspartoacylase family protein [Roseomonas sp. OT10]UFN49416.1 succinylglutamate desuccinylase/aspartoacylase family protein [Roseomonas sp. OT10]
MNLDPPPPLRFPVRLPVPDLRPWRAGNLLPGVWSFAAEAPGPHVALLSLVHGNEIAGALLLSRWLAEGLRPRRGRLTLAFANLDAFDRFDPSDPTLSRYVDEDLNRLWGRAALDGPRDSAELRRARALRPLLDTVDVLLDLHSMLWPSDPLLLSGRTRKAQPLARALGVPGLVVADAGHADGLRLIDYGPFADTASPARALLVEGGPHWEPETPPRLEACALALLRETGLLDGPRPGGPPSALWQVTRTVIANSRNFVFLQDYRGGTVIPERNTLIALDGEAEIRTPHDDCLLVMPSPCVLRGHTAVRLARRVEG